MGYRSSNASKAVGEVKRCFIGKEVHPEQVRVQAEQVPQNKKQLHWFDGFAVTGGIRSSTIQYYAGDESKI